MEKLNDAIQAVNKIDNFVIQHTQWTKVIRGIERCLLMSKGSEEPVNVLLTGSPGTGKTTVCRKILASRKPYIKTDTLFEKTIMPTFFSSVPSPASIKGVVSDMLEAIRDPTPTKGTQLEQTLRLQTLLKECETSSVILDELQHLLKRDKGNQEALQNWLKSCINKFNIPMIIVGTPDCVAIIDADDQLKRRFSRRYTLKNLGFNISSTQCEFKLYMRELVTLCNEVVKMAKISLFKTKDEALQLYIATGGNPHSIHLLFKEAMACAIEEGKSNVETHHFIQAYDELELLNTFSIGSNPFEISTDRLHKEISNLPIAIN